MCVCLHVSFVGVYIHVWVVSVCGLIVQLCLCEYTVVCECVFVCGCDLLGVFVNRFVYVSVCMPLCVRNFRKINIC